MTFIDKQLPTFSNEEISVLLKLSKHSHPKFQPQYKKDYEFVSDFSSKCIAKVSVETIDRAWRIKRDLLGCC